MIRRRVALAAVAAVITVSATAAESADRLDLRGLFQRAPGVADAARPGDAEQSTTTTVELLLARVGPDGKLIKVCVDTEAAARRFLNADVTTLRTQQAKEQ